MKFKRFFSGYTELFSFLSRIFVLFLLCVGISFGVVYPLWNFAVSFPQVYTASIISIFTIFFVAVIFFKTRSYIVSANDSTEKKHRIKLLCFGLLKALLVLSSIAVCLFSLFDGNRLFAVLSLIIAFFLYGLIHFVAKKA